MIEKSIFLYQISRRLIDLLFDPYHRIQRTYKKNNANNFHHYKKSVNFE